MGTIGKCCCGTPVCCCVESITIDIDGYWSATIDLIEVGHSTFVGYVNETTCTYVPAANEFTVCDFFGQSIPSYLHYNIIEEKTFVRDLYLDPFVGFETWLRGNQMWKDVLFWTDLRLEISLKSNGDMKLKLDLYAKQFLIHGIEVGFEGTIRNPNDNCSIVADETEDLGMEDWEPCDSITAQTTSNDCFDYSFLTPIMPNLGQSERIQTNRIFYTLQFTSMVDWSPGDCEDPLTEINDDIFLGYFWIRPEEGETEFCTMPQTLEDVNVADDNCFDYETLETEVTFRTGQQAAPLVVALTATINYCA